MAEEMDRRNDAAGPLAVARRELAAAIDGTFTAYSMAEMDPPPAGTHPVQLARVRGNLATALRFLDWAERDLAGRGTVRPERPGVARVLRELGEGQ